MSDYQEMKKVEDQTRKKDRCIEDNVYMNVEELSGEAKPSETMGKNEAPTTERASTWDMKKAQLFLAAVILLIILFLILIAFTSFLLKYYLAISKEVSQLKNNDNQQQMVLEDIKSFKKDLEIHFRTCPSGWESIGLFCYYFSSEDLLWDNAREECIRNGSALVSIKNKKELDALNSFLKQGRYWIALRRDTDAGKWKWLDGSTLSFSNWKTGEPNNYKDNKEDCVESSFGSWNDLPCDTELKYACKK